jgi:hypothetical protein
MSVKIASHSLWQKVPIGELTISGTSADNQTTNCEVSVDVNDQKPFQNATATGSGRAMSILHGLLYIQTSII